MPPGAPQSDAPASSPIGAPSSDQTTVQLTEAKQKQIRLELVQAQKAAIAR